MVVRKSVVGAAMIALACGSVAMAADQPSVALAPQQPSSSVLSPASVAAQPVYMDAGGPTKLTPLMYELDQTSFGKSLESANLSVTGFVEGGYFYDTSNPRLGTGPQGDSPTFIGFPGAYSNRGLLDQADITFQKTIDATKTWDWGFQVEGGYGTDDSYTHSHGILDTQTPQNQLDLLQANVSVLLPVGSGLTIKAGKFVTLLGDETINPTTNAFYTHSYNFSYAIPYTQTGILASYTFAKAVNGNDLTLTGGVTRGWNQSSLDNNGSADFLGEASGNLTDKLSYIFNVSEGPEAAGDNSNYWTVLDFIPSYQVSDQLKLTLEALWGDYPHGSLSDPGAAAQWYSTVLYAGYTIDSYLTLNTRAEWYRDQGGYTTGLGYSANFYEATVGMQIHPFPNNDILQWLQFRPEVRYDLSDRSVFNDAHTGTIAGFGDYDQFTVAMDAIMQF